MFVTRPIVGRASAHRASIWPVPRMPISTTSTSVSALASRIVSGTPSSLFRLPLVATTLNLIASAAARKSFVVVLPV